MNNKDIEEYVTQYYPKFSKYLETIEEDLVKELDFYKEHYSKWIEDEDFRPGAICRIIATLISSRFIIDNTNNYIDNKDWAKLFSSSYKPEPWKASNSYNHFKSIDLAIRFNLFHSVYHNIEATFRLICKALNLTGKNKPVDRVNKITGIIPEEFIELVDSIRNTIHNNGYYYPLGKQRKEFTYNANEIELTFSEGHTIEVTSIDVLNIIQQYIEHLKNILKHPRILDIKDEKDKG